MSAARSTRGRVSCAAARALLATVLCASGVACQPDFVQAGFYGVPDAGPARTISNAQTGVSGAAANAGSFAGTAGTPSGVAGTQAGVAAGDIGAETAGVGFAADGGDAGPLPCDMRGRWLLTHHVVVDGLGQLQTTHTWKYLEIDQRGDALLVTKGLHCGDDVVARTPLGANADMHGMWPSAMLHMSYDGLQGQSRMTTAGCEVAFAKHYSVLGATVAHYADPSHPLPMLEQQANGTTPGWEDWEGDGEPGVTIVLSGAITGRRFMASRTWHALSGTFASLDGLLKFADDWNQEDVALKIDGSPLLNQKGVRSADMSLHFAEMVRLDDTQATGDDTAICSAVRTLAESLTPNAAAN